MLILHEGPPIESADGEYLGEIDRLVIDPSGRQVTHVVVRKGTFFTEDKVVPMEMIETAEMGALEGTLRKKESNVIKNLLMLDAVKVADIMTPRSVIFAFEDDQTVGQVMEKFKPVRFSRLPVYHEDLDHVLGMVHRYKIMEAYSNDLDDLPISKFMTPIHSIPENISVAAAAFSSQRAVIPHSA